MALIDSEASLKQRCHPIDGDDALFEALKVNGVRTLRQLAFAVGSPQTPTEEALKELAGKLYRSTEASPTTVGQIANVRMLIFEASTLVVAQLRAQATADDTDLTGRKLPHVEKQARLASQKARLPGLLIEGELQPSYALVDACALMAESNSITWISPSRCSKRDAEVQMLGKERSSLVHLEAGGTLKVSASNKLPDADTTTALQLLYCLQRRGLALDQCSLINWPDHEWYVQSLVSFLHAEPVAGARTSVAQVIRADKEAWTLMSREIEGPIGVKNAAGELVMAAALRRLAKDPRVVVHLVTAMPGGKGGVPPPPAPPKDAAAAAALAEKKQKKRKRISDLLPESLKGCVTKIKAGPVCWAYNLPEGCSAETKKDAHGIRCAKGYHVCAGCHKAGHSFVSCKKNAS